ncbi:hypothetical protein [Robertmurraya andreesenii]|uniref:Uncharacterized protein n=1 Tax=Anoxybacillus andreesenii TaxID=1325932 RepID=A0ABT9V5N3_9BACL|nr:hypothetical protein [Robertmurraya andreesenii]MDQ0156253.1 hypothetical protein [Robertmurraya andreesenii]
MNKKRLRFFLTFWLIFVCVFSSSFIEYRPIQAEGNFVSAAANHSGGFVIQSEKVDGMLDLLGILAGKITIFDGDIYGLTITKRLNVGGNQEPLMIKITSPGPIPVNNLKATTLGNRIPEFGGLCMPSRLGRLCMENVVMTVTDQAAAAISLPNAKIETCYESQCGSIPEGGSMSEEEFKKLLEELEANELSLKDILDEMRKDSEKVSLLEQLINQASKALAEIDLDQPNTLKELLAKITNDLTEENIAQVDQAQLIDDTKALWEQQDSYIQAISPFLEIMDDATSLADQLEANLKKMEESLKKIESMEVQETTDKKLQLVKRYAELIKVAEEIKNGSDQAEQPNSEEIDLKMVRNKLEEYKKIIHPFIEQLRELQTEKDGIEATKVEIETKSSELKERIISLKEILGDDVVASLLGNDAPKQGDAASSEETEDNQHTESDSKPEPNWESDHNGGDENKSNPPESGLPVEAPNKTGVPASEASTDVPVEESEVPSQVKESRLRKWLDDVKDWLKSP